MYRPKDLTEYKRHILLSLDTIMGWANECLPEDDLYGWIDGYGKMPAEPQLYNEMHSGGLTLNK